MRRTFELATARGVETASPARRHPAAGSMPAARTDPAAGTIAPNGVRSTAGAKR